MNPSISPLSSPSTLSKSIIDLCSTNKRDSEDNFITFFSNDDDKPKKECGVARYKFESVCVTYHKNLDMLSFFRIVVVCEKFVTANDPYGFRLLLMGRRNHGIDKGNWCLLWNLSTRLLKFLVVSQCLLMLELPFVILNIIYFGHEEKVGGGETHE